MKHLTAYFAWYHQLAAFICLMILVSCSSGGGDTRQANGQHSQARMEQEKDSIAHTEGKQTSQLDTRKRYEHIGDEPPELDPFVLEPPYRGVEEKDPSIKTNRERGDILAYDFCGEENDHLSPAVKHTVKAIAGVVKESLSLRNCEKELVTALRALKSLNLAQRDIVDLSPLTEMTNLEVLDLSKNKIEASQLYSLRNMKKLRKLSLAHNKLNSAAALGELTSLQSLDLSYNQLQEVSSLSTLTKLKSLNLKSNRVKSIVYLKDLKIKAINISDNPGIKTEIASYTSQKDHPCDESIPWYSVLKLGYCFINSVLVCFDDAAGCTELLTSF